MSKFVNICKNEENFDSNSAAALLTHFHTCSQWNVFVGIDINKRKFISNLLFCTSEQTCRKDVTCSCGLFIPIRVSRPKITFRFDRLMHLNGFFPPNLSYSLLISKNVETQTLEATSAIVQKRFAKTDYLSGNKCRFLDCRRHKEVLIFGYWVFSLFSWHIVDRTDPTRRSNINCFENMCVFYYAGFISRKRPEL